MSKFDAVAIFGTRLQDDDTFLPFVYQEIDRAASLITEGLAPQVIFCGSHWAGEKFRGVRESDVAEVYFKDMYPQLARAFLKESQSTCVQENWLFMKVGFPSIRRIYHITIRPFLPRMAFTGDWIYGNDGVITHEALPWPVTNFPHEAQLLRDAKCIFTVYNHMERGHHNFLLNPKTGESKWQELWWAHGNCSSCYPK
jgi:hypothetical protein